MPADVSRLDLALLLLVLTVVHLADQPVLFVLIHVIHR